MAGRDAFPYPDDDPASVRVLGRKLSALHAALKTSATRVDEQYAALADRWLGDAGPRASSEILNINVALALSHRALEPLHQEATTFADALDTARTTIDELRTEYDTAETDYLNAKARLPVGGPSVNPALEEALDARGTAIRKLTVRYNDACDAVRVAGRRLGGSLLKAAGTWSAAPASANPGLARLKALDLLRFMAPWNGGTAITRTGGLILVDTGPADDKVTMRVDPKTGDVIVTVNGVDHRFTAAEAQGLVIRTGEGKDVVEVPKGTQVGFTILTEGGDDRVTGGDGADLIGTGYGNDDVNGGGGDDAADLGAGNDQYHDLPTPTFFGRVLVPFGATSGKDVVAGGEGDDLIKTGGGDDHVDGGDGNDRIDTGRGDDTIDGGKGEDRIYAGNGADIVRGGDDNDYIEGGTGNDTIDGGAGKDTLSGGRDDDTITGGGDDDVIYAGLGRDRVVDDAGINIVYAEAGDTVGGSPTTYKLTIEIAEIPANIHIEGSPDFVDRTQADLDLLAASPTGQQMLERLGGADGHEILIRELTPEQQKTAAGLHWMEGDTAITAIASDVPTIDVMYHEMNHADASLYDVAAPGMYTGGEVRHMPAYLDLDKDGFISKKELDWNADGRIEDIDLDLNGDGEVNGDDGWLPNFERQATGQPIDPDNDPDTPDVPAWTVVDQPEAVTVNALRNEMGLPPM